MKRRLCLIAFGVVILLATCLYATALQVTFTEFQIQEAAEKYYRQKEGKQVECQLLEKKQMDQKLFCLFEVEHTPFFIEFTKSKLMPERYYQTFGHIPSPQERGGVTELTIHRESLYSYIIFGPTPDGVNELFVDILDENGERTKRFYRGIDSKENWFFCVVNKYCATPLSFRYTMVS